MSWCRPRAVAEVSCFVNNVNKGRHNVLSHVSVHGISECQVINKSPWAKRGQDVICTCAMEWHCCRNAYPLLTRGIRANCYTQTLFLNVESMQLHFEQWSKYASQFSSIFSLKMIKGMQCLSEATIHAGSIDKLCIAELCFTQYYVQESGAKH